MMGRSRYLFTLMLGLSAAACQSVPVVPALPPSAADAPPASGSWRATSTDPAKGRISGWDGSWDAALAGGPEQGHGRGDQRESGRRQAREASEQQHEGAGV